MFSKPSQKLKESSYFRFYSFGPKQKRSTEILTQPQVLHRAVLANFPIVCQSTVPKPFITFCMASMHLSFQKPQQITLTY